MNVGVDLSVAELRKRRATVVMADLPAGTYALAIHHDENGNTEHDQRHNGQVDDLPGDLRLQRIIRVASIDNVLNRAAKVA